MDELTIQRKLFMSLIHRKQRYEPLQQVGGSGRQLGGHGGNVTENWRHGWRQLAAVGSTFPVPPPVISTLSRRSEYYVFLVLLLYHHPIVEFLVAFPSTNLFHPSFLRQICSRL
jgi:hypothetical protein